MMRISDFIRLVALFWGGYILEVMTITGSQVILHGLLELGFNDIISVFVASSFYAAMCSCVVILVQVYVCFAKTPDPAKNFMLGFRNSMYITVFVMFGTYLGADSLLLRRNTLIAHSVVFIFVNVYRTYQIHGMIPRMIAPAANRQRVDNPIVVGQAHAAPALQHRVNNPVVVGQAQANVWREDEHPRATLRIVKYYELNKVQKKDDAGGGRGDSAEMKGAVDYSDDDGSHYSYGWSDEEDYYEEKRFAEVVSMCGGDALRARRLIDTNYEDDYDNYGIARMFENSADEYEGIERMFGGKRFEGSFNPYGNGQTTREERVDALLDKFLGMKGSFADAMELRRLNVSNHEARNKLGEGYKEILACARSMAAEQAAVEGLAKRLDFKKASDERAFKTSLRNFMSKRREKAKGKAKPEANKQLSVRPQVIKEKKNTRYDILDLDGFLYDVRDVFAYEAKPEDYGLTQKSYRDGLRLLEWIYNKVVVTGESQVNVLSWAFALNQARRLIETVWTISDVPLEAIKKAWKDFPSPRDIAKNVLDFIGDIVGLVNLQGKAFYTFLTVKFVAWGLKVGAWWTTFTEDTEGLKEYLNKLNKSAPVKPAVPRIEEVGEAQGHVVDEHVGVAVIKLIAHVVFGYGPLEVNRERAKRISTLFSGLNSVVALVRNIGFVFEEVVDEISIALFDRCLTKDVPNQLIAEMKASMATMKDALLIGATTFASAREVLAIVPAMSEMHAKVTDQMLLTPLKYFDHWISMYNQFQRLVVEAKGRIGSDKLKQAPIMWQVSGDSGIGKTSLIAALARIGHIHQYKKDIDYSPVYVWNADKKYMEGYVEDKTSSILIDEAYAFKEAEVAMKTSAMILHVAGNQPTPAEMAFEQKGKVNLTPIMVWVVSNWSAITKDLVQTHFVMPVARRLQVVRVRVKPNRGYDPKTKKWDHEFSFETAKGDYEFDIGHYQGDETKQEIVYTKVGISLMDLIKMMCEQLDVKKRELERLLSELQSIDLAKVERMLLPSDEQLSQTIKQVKRDREILYELSGEESDESDTGAGVRITKQGGEIDISKLDPKGKWKDEASTSDIGEAQGFIERVKAYWASKTQAPPKTIDIDSEDAFTAKVNVLVLDYMTRYAENQPIQFVGLLRQCVAMGKKLDDCYQINKGFNRDEILSHVPKSKRHMLKDAREMLDELKSWSQHGVHFRYDLEDTDTLYAKFMRAVDAAGNFVYSYWKPLAIGVVSIVSGLGLAFAMAHGGDDDDKEGEAEGNYDKVHNSVERARKNIRKGVRKPVKGEAQVSDPGTRDLMRSVARSFGSWTITTTVDGHPIRMEGIALNVKGSAWIMPCHYFEYADLLDQSKTTVTIKTQAAKVTIPYEELRISSWDEDDNSFVCDMLTVIVPRKYLPIGRDLTNLFVPEKEVDQRVNGNVVRLRPEVDHAVHVAEPALDGRPNFVSQVGEIPGGGKGSATAIEKGGTAYTTMYGVLYDIRSQRGDCGALYMLDNVHAPHKLIGLHVGAVAGRGLMALVTQEMLAKYVDPLLEELGPVGVAQGAILNVGSEKLEPIELVHELTDDAKKLGEGVIYMGSLPEAHKKFANYPPDKSKIERTRMFADFVPEKAPAKLAREGDYKPLEAALQKDGTPYVQVKEPLVDFVWKDFEKRAMTLVKKCKLNRWLTLKEAVSHHINAERTSNMDMHTSPGSFMKGLGYEGKTEFLMPNPDSTDVVHPVLPTPKLEKIVNGVLDYIRTKKIPVFVFLCTLKDELRIMSKITAPRLFFAANLVYNILARMNYGAFIETFIAHPIEMQHTLGSDLNSATGRYLNQIVRNANKLTTDCSGNDRLKDRDALWRYFKVADAFNARLEVLQNVPQADRDFYALVATTVSENTMSSVCAVWGVVYQNTHKIMSGSLFTTPSNTPTVGNEMRVCVLAYLRDHNPGLFERYVNNMEEFHFENNILTHGDDVFGYTVVPLSEVELNPYDSVIYGRKLTAADKSQGFGQNDIIHLSRSPSKWGWRLPKATIESIVLYRLKNSIPDSEMYRQLCEAALAEWFFWGYEVFNEKKKLYDAELMSLGYQPTRFDYAKHANDMILRH